VVAVVVVTLVVAVGLVGTSGRPADSPAWSFPTTSHAAGATAAPEEWAALSLPPFEPLADLVADASDGSGLSRESTFTLRSMTATSAVALAAGLSATPVPRPRWRPSGRRACSSRARDTASG
jgi:hypothetical protein